MRSPTNSDRLANNIDNGEEESARIGPPSSSPALDSSVLMAHKDVAPQTKGGTHCVHITAESTEENGMETEKKQRSNHHSLCEWKQ